MKLHVEWKWAGMLLFLLATYVVVTVFGARCVAKQFRRTGHVWQRAFYVFLFLGALTRAVYFGTVLYVQSAGVHLWTPVLFLVNTAPSFLFFSAFLILLFLLIEIYSGQVRHARVFIGFNIVLYVAYLGATAANFAISPQSRFNERQSNNMVENGIVLFYVSVYLITAAAFAVYGLRLRVAIRKLTLNKVRQALISKVTAIASIVSCFFVIRSGLVLFALFREHVNFVWWFFGLYYIALEVCPVVCMLMLLRRPSSSPPPSSSPHLSASYSSIPPPSLPTHATPDSDASPSSPSFPSPYTSHTGSHHPISHASPLLPGHDRIVNHSPYARPSSRSRTQQAFLSLAHSQPR